MLRVQWVFIFQGGPGRSPFHPHNSGAGIPHTNGGARHNSNGGGIAAPGLRLSGPMHHSIPPPAPSPFISPGLSHGGALDFYTPKNELVQRPAVMHSGGGIPLGGLLRSNGSGGNNITNGGGMMGPPGSRVIHGGGRRDSLIPSGHGRTNINVNGTPHGLEFNNGHGGGNGSRRPTLR